MPLRSPSRYVVRPHDTREQRRRRLWLGAAWLASLLLVGVAANLAGSHRRGKPPAPARHPSRSAALAAQNEDLKQQLANLQRSQQVGDIATRSLRQSLAERDEEISGLRADLAFYSRLTGSNAGRDGLRVQDVRLDPVRGTPAWNLTLSLTQSRKRGDDIRGIATVSVDGLRGGQVVQLEWPALGDATQRNGMPFRLRYFQQVHATIVLPADFRPTRLHVDVRPSGGNAVDRAIAWNDALTGYPAIAQGEHHAQPQTP